MMHYQFKRLLILKPAAALFAGGAGVTLFCSAFLAASPAMAREMEQTAMADGYHPVERVQYDDLDLDTPQGRARLDARIASAVDHVCGNADIRDLRGVAAVNDCRDESLHQAISARDTMLASRGDGQRVAALTITSRSASR